MIQLKLSMERTNWICWIDTKLIQLQCKDWILKRKTFLSFTGIITNPNNGTISTKIPQNTIHFASTVILLLFQNHPSAQIIIFQQPRFRWNKASDFPSSATFWGKVHQHSSKKGYPHHQSLTVRPSKSLPKPNFGKDRNFQLPLFMAHLTVEFFRFIGGPS